jgi:hypothetical protein
MKKNQTRQRKLRKCERGIKTKNLLKGHRHVMIDGKLAPVMWATKHIPPTYGF